MEVTGAQGLHRLIRCIAAAALLMLSAACTVSPKVTVAVDAISATAVADDPRYVLVPVVAGVDESDLHFREYAEHIHNALKGSGMRRAESAELANVEIEVNYGSSPQQRLVTVPGLHRRASLNDRHCVHRDPRGRCRQWRSRLFSDRFDLFDRQVGDNVRVRSYYRIFLTLEAFDKTAVEKRSPLWVTRARIESNRSDMRLAMPALIEAAADYIGEDTGREVYVTLAARQR